MRKDASFHPFIPPFRGLSMRSMSFPVRSTALFLVLSALASFSVPAAAAQEEKKVLTLDDYDRWSRIGSTALSPDGRWTSTAASLNKGETRFIVKNVETDAAVEIAGGGRPEFSDDAKWLGYVVPSEEEREKLQKAQQPVVVRAELRNLATGEVASYDNVMKQYFDHHLKGEPAAGWIEKGLPFLKKVTAETAGADRR